MERLVEPVVIIFLCIVKNYADSARGSFALSLSSGVKPDPAQRGDYSLRTSVDA